MALADDTALASRETLGARVARFFRSSAVGIVATVLDFAVLELCLRGLGLSTLVAKGFSLTVGTATQFFGNRYFAFHAQRGRLERQLRAFVLVEVLAFVATVAVFKLFVDVARVPVEVANVLSGMIVYFGFSYPLWHWVFRERREEPSAP